MRVRCGVMWNGWEIKTRKKAWSFWRGKVEIELGKWTEWIADATVHCSL